MGKKASKEDHTVVMSDRYLSEAGIQGGKALGDHLALGSLIIGIPLFFIGIYGLLNMLLGWGFPTNNAIIILVLLVTIIGFLMTIGGYNIFKSKHSTE